MSILSSIYKHTLARVLPLSPEIENSTKKSRKRKFSEPEDKELISRRRKREDSDTEKEVITKRRRVDNDHFAPIVDGETYESALITGQQSHHNEESQKRTMVPPPALNAAKIRSINKLIKENGNRRASIDNMDTQSQASVNIKNTQQRTADELGDEYDMEKARRHVAATTLPPNSGVWERGEKELFFHLSYRGFEPLFPANWMRDFRTMPLSLYHRPYDELPPLIEPHRLGEFRAIRELRELLELGKNVRDQVLSSPGVKREATIERATNKYISWAIRDAGIKLPVSGASRSRKSDTVLPIHVIVKLKSKQTTTECLLEIKTKLHELAARHRRARNIHASIERDEFGYGTPESDDETRVVESFEDDLPVLYGIMICKSVLAIFTLNSRTPPPLLSNHAVTPSERILSNDTQSVTSMDVELENQPTHSLGTKIYPVEDYEYGAASDPRFISDFDFSDSAKDVWNALVIAIVAMQIRKDMLLLQQAESEIGMEERIQQGIEEMSVDEDDDDPDA